MANEVEVRDNTDEVGAERSSAPAAPHVADPLRSLRVVKWLTRLFVYPGVTALIPLDHAVSGLTWQQAISVHLGGYVIATLAIEFAFGQVFKLRKRGAYPGIILAALGRGQRVDAAAQHGLDVIQRLLGLRASLLALGRSADDVNLVSVSGMSGEAAERFLEARMATVHEAMRTRRPVPLNPADGSLSEAGVSRAERLVFIPVVALREPIGILAVVGRKGSGDVKDRELLGAIGNALGLSLENLRQKEELRESEERLRTVVAATPIAMFAANRQGVITVAEGKGLEVLGLKPDQVIGQSIFDIYSDVPQIGESFRRALAGDTFTSVAEVGGVMFEAWQSPLRDQNGEIAGVTGVVTDITERKRAEEALRATQERLRTVVAGAPIVMFAADRDGVITLAEGKGLEALGLKPDQVIGQSIFDIYRDTPQARHNFHRALAGDTFTSMAEMGGLTFEAREAPLRDQNGEITGITGVVTDITERKRAEEALQESETKFRTLTETVAAAAFIFQGTRIRYVNSAAEASTGYTRQEMLTMNFWEVIHPDFREEVRERGLARQRGEPVPPRYELKLLTKGGEELWVDFTAGITEFEGKPAILGTCFDITERKRAEEALRQSEERYRLLAENATDVIWTRDLTLQATYTSPSITRLRGVTVEEAMAQKLEETLTPTSLELARRTLAEELARENTEHKDLSRSRTLELEMIRKDGSTVWTEVTVTFLRDQGNRPVGILGVTRDISERKRAEEALRESETKFRTLAETIAAAAFIYQGTRFRYVNSAAEDITGYTRKELLRMNFWDVVHPDFREDIRERGLARQRGDRAPGRYETKLLTKNGDERWLDLTVGVIEFNGKPAVLGTGFDVTERRRAEETIKHLAYHDALTDLPNRALFQDRLTIALAQARRKKRMVAVLFLDLDHFKVVNDTVGHAEGDKLLQRVGERLTTLVREGDTVARVGGDEFTLLFPEVAGVEDTAEIAERVLKTLQQPWALDGHEFHVTTSVGIATYPNDGEDAESLLQNADTAMYRAKEQGRNTYQLYAPAMNARIVERLALENSLRSGLERGEFVVYYQPQINIRTGQVVGVEALVRWHHPERGLVLPAEFIPVAEETGLIVPLGEWVLRTACAQNKAWQEAGLPSMRVAVNLSARQFQQRNLTDMVAQVLQETGLDPHWLALEITEGIAMQDVGFTIAMLRDLREMGVQIAIDDFGTGYSSLSYLKRFPIDAVKIDRSFVRDLTVDPNDAAIATTVITMAHNLKLSVIAEGVETEEQLAFLKQQRCDEMQGFLFSKAVPAKAIEKITRTDRRRAGARVPARPA